jgi:7-carboxy-7-deazaguanine synthase
MDLMPDPLDHTREAGLATRVHASPRGRKRYTVKAVWRTVQGEGTWAGRPAVFVRFAACNLWTGYEADRERDAARSGAACPLWCDTDFTKEGAVGLDAADLAAEVARTAREGDSAVDFVVLTGGEPLLQADAALIQALHEKDFEVACETNGTLRLADRFATENGDLLPPDWIVCSPKLAEDLLVLERFDELKLVVPDYRPEAYREFARRARTHTFGGRERRFLWLQPEDGRRREEATRLAVRLAQQNPEWRVSVQTHKVLGVD